MTARLALDDPTRADLGIQAAEGDAGRLRAFIDRTQTTGGARALASRLNAPSADPGTIRSTQRAVAQLVEAPALLEALPNAYVTTGVERYLRSPLPRITGEGALEFGVGVAALWLDGYRDYSSIVHGVQLTRRLLRGLLAVCEGLEAAGPEGELAMLVSSLRTGLDASGLARARALIASRTVDGPLGPWRTLRLDQAFRQHARGAVEALLGHLHALDALRSLAETTRREALVMPELVDGAPFLEADELAHPLVEAGVGNPVALGPQASLLFLTGPNMAGKTTYLRSVATAIYCAQLGMGVRARAFRFAPVDCLHTAFSLHDDLAAGVSYFRAEALRIRAVAEALSRGERVLALLDEPFKGTNVKDAFDASDAVLRRFAAHDACLVICSSHLIELAEPLSRVERVRFRYFQAEESGGRLAFDYRVREGVSEQRLGMRVLREEGVFELLGDLPD